MSEYMKGQIKYDELGEQSPQDVLERARKIWRHQTRAHTHLQFKRADALEACLDLLQRRSLPEKEIWYQEDVHAMGLRRQMTLERYLEETYVIKTNIEVKPGSFVAIAIRTGSMTAPHRYACFIRPQEMDNWQRERQLEVEWTKNLDDVVEQLYQYAIQYGFVPLNSPEAEPTRPNGAPQADAPAATPRLPN